MRSLCRTCCAGPRATTADVALSPPSQPKKLPADEGQWSITLPEDDGTKSRNSGGRDFTIKIRFTRSIDLERLAIFVRGDLRGQSIEPDASEVQSAIQALNVLIQHGPTMLYPSRNASFFLPPQDQRQASLSRGLVMWRGFYSSLRLGPEQLYLNLDIASQPMVAAGSLPDIILDFLKAGSRNISFQQMSAKTIPGTGASPSPCRPFVLSRLESSRVGRGSSAATSRTRTDPLDRRAQR